MLYNVDGTIVHTFKGHTSQPNALSVSRHHRLGQLIVSGSRDRHVKVWSVAGRHLLSDCTWHTSSVYAVAAMPDGKRFLSGSWNGEILVSFLYGAVASTFSGMHRTQVSHHPCACCALKTHVSTSSTSTTAPCFAR